MVLAGLLLVVLKTAKTSPEVRPDKTAGRFKYCEFAAVK
jgi:hypothetical protein